MLALALFDANVDLETAQAKICGQGQLNRSLKGIREKGPMKTMKTLAAVSAALVAQGAIADVAGLVQDGVSYYRLDGTSVVSASLEDAQYAVIDVYVDFSAPNTQDHENSESFLLNMFQVNVNTSGMGSFQQNDLTAEGSWIPSYSANLPGAGAFSQIDSFVTINSVVGEESAFNLTTLDPGFGEGTNDDIFRTDVGWYQVPPNADGGVMADLRVWIGRFVATGEEARNDAGFQMTSRVGYDYQDDTIPYYGDASGEFSFIPAPGVLTAMMLGSVGLRRRQRRK